jgi:hypothetical protein
MSLRERERRAAQRRQAEDLREQLRYDPNRICSFQVWCELAGVSPATGRRILASGQGQRVIQLSARRIGIRYADHLRWPNVKSGDRRTACIRSRTS